MDDDWPLIALCLWPIIKVNYHLITCLIHIFVMALKQYLLEGPRQGSNLRNTFEVPLDSATYGTVVQRTVVPYYML